LPKEREREKDAGNVMKIRRGKKEIVSITWLAKMSRVEN
jgi:hypothetical protein